MSDRLSHRTTSGRRGLLLAALAFLLLLIGFDLLRGDASALRALLRNDRPTRGEELRDRVLRTR